MNDTFHTESLEIMNENALTSISPVMQTSLISASSLYWYSNLYIRFSHIIQVSFLFYCQLSISFMQKAMLVIC